MTGLSLNDFLEKVASGDEIEFLFNGKHYLYQGYYEDGLYVSAVDCWDDSKSSAFNGYIYELRSKDLSERLDAFDTAKIFDGKTIYEVEDKITVLYG
jgi:hypothetical protein